MFVICGLLEAKHNIFKERHDCDNFMIKNGVERNRTNDKSDFIPKPKSQALFLSPMLIIWRSLLKKCHCCGFTYRTKNILGKPKENRDEKKGGVFLSFPHCLDFQSEKCVKLRLGK